MAEQSSGELQKLAGIATDMQFNADMRTKAQESIGRIGSHEALLVLLEIAANEKLNRNERELSLKYAGQIIKASN